MQTHTQQAILHKFLGRVLRKCRIPREEESTTPFEEEPPRASGLVSCIRVSLRSGQYRLIPVQKDLKSSALSLIIDLDF